MQQDLNNKYKIVAGAHNLKDFTDLLEALAVRASDVRTEIGVKPDSLEIRKAITSYLQESIDTIRRIRNNVGTRRPEDYSSEDSL